MITYETICNELVLAVPEFKLYPPYVALVARGEALDQYAVFTLLKQFYADAWHIKHAGTLERISNFVKRVAETPTVEVQELLAHTFLDGFENNVSLVD